MALGVCVRRGTNAALGLFLLACGRFHRDSASDPLRSSVARHSIGHSASEKVKHGRFTPLTKAKKIPTKEEELEKIFFKYIYINDWTPLS